MLSYRTLGRLSWSLYTIILSCILGGRLEILVADASRYNPFMWDHRSRDIRQGGLGWVVRRADLLVGGAVDSGQASIIGKSIRVIILL